jgi:hypothetical protein
MKPMRRFAVVATAVLVAGPLLAGTRIQMENTDLAANKTATEVILMDNTRLRVDADANTSVLFLTDGGRNRMVILDKTKNTYQEIDEQMMKQMGQQMAGAMAQMDAAMKNMPPEQRAMMEKMMKGKMPQATPTVRTVYSAKGSGTVNGFSCTKYEGMRGAEKVAEVCAASASQIKVTPGDYQVFEKMKQFTSGLQDAMKNSPFATGIQSASVADSGVEGFPVQTVSFRNGQAAIRTELKSVTNASFSDADFSVGAAKKIEMPAMGGPPQGKTR